MEINRVGVSVWSKKIRLFHWLNVIAITMLIVVGLIILNSKLLGISTEGKVLLKTIHVCIGYVFVCNLVVRIILGFMGKGYERWRLTLPFFAGFKNELKAFKANPNKVYKGHNPLGKLMVLALITLMSVQAISGLVIAGTDIYFPPFGDYFANSIAIDQSQVAQIQPYSKVNVDEEKYQAMRAFRSPFITAHVYAFYGLLCLIPLHIIGVIVAEKKEKSGLVSAMINGIKYLPKNSDKE